MRGHLLRKSSNGSFILTLWTIPNEPELSAEPERLDNPWFDQRHAFLCDRVTSGLDSDGVNTGNARRSVLFHCHAGVHQLA